MVKRDPPVVIVGLVGCCGTVIRDYGRETAPPDNAAGKAVYYPCSRIRPRASAWGCACIMRKQALLEEMAGSLVYVGLRSRMNKEQS
ncbi:Uncharacterised protein [Escherichia coli]|uniref:Uncharacterized protein n=1 Tax=Escherichia coli TaxID=562 RepID=A0A376MN22_ECOLX|nr:Uncharacterised protein [Escherichia coli]